MDMDMDMGPREAAPGAVDEVPCIAKDLSEIFPAVGIAAVAARACKNRLLPARVMLRAEHKLVRRLPMRPLAIW